MAYFAALSSVKDDMGRKRLAIHFYRSEDGGREWSKPLDLGYSYDHPQIAVDQTLGRFAGRVYIGALYGAGRDYSLGVFRSDDGGRSFTGPVKVLDGGGIGVNVTTLMVLSDGALAMTYADFQIDPAKRAKARESGTWLVTSNDGGVTFSPPVRIAALATPGENLQTLRLSTFAVYAADSRSKQYRDRLYSAWTDFSAGNPRVVFTSSSDGGKTWRAPRPVDGQTPAGTIQYQPAIAVNDQGVVGVIWFDTRGLKPDGSEYHVYFTASVDGGETFLPPVQLSSAPSYRWGAGNYAISPSAWGDPKKNLRITFLSAAARWGHGGDYIGLTTDGEGTFHPFWPDSRTGTFQAMTSRVRVAPAALPAPSAYAEATDGNSTSVTDRVEFVFDLTTYDPATQELSLPIRLKNISGEPIHKPISVVVKAFGSGTGEMFREKAPAILNAANGKPREGAVFDYSSALRDLEALEPNAMTEAMV